MTNKKNIAVFSRSTHHHFISGGMETQLKSLTEGFAKSNIVPIVFTTSYPGKMSEDVVLKENGVLYIFIKDTTPGLYPMGIFEKFWNKIGQLDRKTNVEGTSNYFDESIKYFNRYNKNLKFDVILSQSTSARKVIFTNDLPVVSIIHGTILAEVKNRIKSNKTLKNWVRFLFLDLPNWILEKIFINKKFFYRSDKVVAVSDNLKKQFLFEYPKLKNKVNVIYNGVDTLRFFPGKKKDKFIFLYIGRIDREKGVDIILNAVKQLIGKTKKSFKVKIVGSGVNLDEFKMYSKQIHVNSVVEFVGAVKNEEINRYYREASVFIFPTRREEGHPMTISESFCSGLPVIASAKGGLIDVIDDGVNGFLIKEDDVDDLFVKMKELLDDVTLVSTLSKNALEEGFKNFSQDVMIKKYIKTLETL